MKAAVFAPLRNAHGLCDADEFLREAHAFNRAHGYDDAVCRFDNRLPLLDRRGEVIDYLRDLQGVSTLAMFCHGWADGVQAGFTCAHVRGLAVELKTVCAPELTVVLYCCTTGADNIAATPETAPGPGGDGGFADRLRDELCEQGVRATVFAHSVKGHTTRNPYVRVFTPDHRKGGEWLVEPHGPLWRKWERALKLTDLRLKFPFVPRDLLERWLRGGGKGGDK